MYTVHYFPDTASLVVRIVLTELGVPASHKLIDREGGALASMAYRAMNPLGQIPALETPDGAMFETAAILLYLADRHQALAPAPNSAQRGAFLKWYFFVSSNIHPTLLQLFYPGRVAGPDAIDLVVPAAAARMNAYLDILETMISTDQPDWLSTKAPSILGHYLGMLIHWLNSFGPDDAFHLTANAYPALFGVLAAHEARAAVQTIAQSEDLATPLYTSPCY